MTKRFASLCLIGSALLLLPHIAMGASTADPQQPYNAPDSQSPGEPAPASAAAAPSASYGGGFLEFLLTGGGALAPASASSQTTADPAFAQAPAPPSALRTDAEPDAVQRGIDPIYLRQEVDYSGPQRPGTIVIDTPNKFLFLVEKGGKALRYGIGVGRPGFAWSGVKAISRKAEWPDWTPPSDMLKRRPDLPTHMAGGPENPLGARALYLGSSLYRIHGTNEPYTIGTNVSSGCIRMMNEDVIDLYHRVGVGTKVIVM
jgi:lipoprotein-anchoring transpeptidase ErfK/SrfK